METLGILIKWEGGDVGREWIGAQWDLDHVPNPWGKVKGPMGAEQMHLKDMQWQIRWCSGTLQLRDHESQVWQPNPEYGMG
eukprot:11358200-Karenia_brevis.AAC.1